MLYHATRVHDKINKKIQYNIFNNTFTSQNGLQYHLKSVHEGEKPFSCESCPKNFTSKQGLNYHIEKCTSSYESKQDLKIHTETVHDRKKQFKCQICNENFAAKQDLIIHSASIHNGTKSLKTFKCDLYRVFHSDMRETKALYGHLQMNFHL